MIQWMDTDAISLDAEERLAGVETRLRYGTVPTYDDPIFTSISTRRDMRNDMYPVS